MNSKRIILGVDDFEKAKKDVYKLLVSRWYRVKEECEKFCIKAKEISIGKICREVVMAGVDINHLTNEEKSLEDIFLSLIRGGKVMLITLVKNEFLKQKRSLLIFIIVFLHSK